MSCGKAKYQRRLSVPAILASISRYIGLFGTMLGIVRSFRDMSEGPIGSLRTQPAGS
jgi:biopolymer transport protein ExbB/TolQ